MSHRKPLSNHEIQEPTMEQEDTAQKQEAKDTNNPPQDHSTHNANGNQGEEKVSDQGAHSISKEEPKQPEPTPDAQTENSSGSNNNQEKIIEAQHVQSSEKNEEPQSEKSNTQTQQNSPSDESKPD